MSLEISVASPKDVPSIVNLIRMGIKERAFHNREVSVEGYLEYAFDDRQKGFNLFICQIEDEIVGYIDSLVGRWGVGHISGIYVRPEHRRKGIGGLLMEKILDRFRMNDCHKARLEVFADDQGAIKFYSRYEFVQEGYLQKDQARRDIVIMSRFLEVTEENSF